MEVLSRPKSLTLLTSGLDVDLEPREETPRLQLPEELEARIAPQVGWGCGPVK